jgi:hypothetical protein
MVAAATITIAGAPEEVEVFSLHTSRRVAVRMLGQQERALANRAARDANATTHAGSAVVLTYPMCESPSHRINRKSAARMPG